MFQAVLSGDQDSSDWVRLALPYIIRFVGPIIELPKIITRIGNTFQPNMR